MENTLQDFFERVLSVRLTPERDAVDILDQTCLPREEKRLLLRDIEEMYEAILHLRVRGAPAIGVFAASSMAVLASSYTESSRADFLEHFRRDKNCLQGARPTAVNLSWALERMERVLLEAPEASPSQWKALLFQEAERIREEDIAISRSIGEYGFQLMQSLKKEGKALGIQTHCNAGTLATAKYGTATAPLYLALEHGWKPEALRVYCDETRPLLQGARLTSYELSAAGIPTTVIADNMAASLLAEGKVDIIFVGCDRVARNGDTANKIGTAGLAVLASYYHVPFYVCAPSSTLDPKARDGRDIPIEYRDGEELRSAWYREAMIPERAEVWNPAFDVSDHRLITGIITERGICRGDFESAFRNLGFF